MGISRDGGRREALFATGARCGEVPWISAGLSGDGTGTVRVGGGNDILFGIGGGGGTRARAGAGSTLILPGARRKGAGGSGRVTRGGAISLSLVLSVERVCARDSLSGCVCGAPKSSVAYWPSMVMGLGAAVTASLASLTPPCISGCCPNSAACVNVFTPASCATRVCASSQSIVPSNPLNDSSPRACCNGACVWRSDSMKRTKTLH